MFRNYCAYEKNLRIYVMLIQSTLVNRAPQGTDSKVLCYRFICNFEIKFAKKFCRCLPNAFIIAFGRDRRICVLLTVVLRYTRAPLTRVNYTRKVLLTTPSSLYTPTTCDLRLTKMYDEKYD